MENLAKKRRKRGAKARIGRPTVEIARDRYLRVRFTPAELDGLRDSAEREGATLSQFVRDRLGLQRTGYGERQ